MGGPGLATGANGSSCPCSPTHPHLSPRRRPHASPAGSGSASVLNSPAFKQGSSRSKRRLFFPDSPSATAPQNDFFAPAAPLISPSSSTIPTVLPYATSPLQEFLATTPYESRTVARILTSLLAAMHAGTVSADELELASSALLEKLGRAMHVPDLSTQTLASAVLHALASTYRPQLSPATLGSIQAALADIIAVPPTRPLLAVEQGSATASSVGASGPDASRTDLRTAPLSSRSSPAREAMSLSTGIPQYLAPIRADLDSDIVTSEAKRAAGNAAPRLVPGLDDWIVARVRSAAQSLTPSSLQSSESLAAEGSSARSDSERAVPSPVVDRRCATTDPLRAPTDSIPLSRQRRSGSSGALRSWLPGQVPPVDRAVTHPQTSDFLARLHESAPSDDAAPMERTAQTPLSQALTPAAKRIFDDTDATACWPSDGFSGNPELHAQSPWLIAVLAFAHLAADPALDPILALERSGGIQALVDVASGAAHGPAAAEAAAHALSHVLAAASSAPPVAIVKQLSTDSSTSECSEPLRRKEQRRFPVRAPPTFALRKQFVQVASDLLYTGPVATHQYALFMLSTALLSPDSEPQVLQAAVDVGAFEAVTAALDDARPLRGGSWNPTASRLLRQDPEQAAGCESVAAVAASTMRDLASADLLILSHLVHANALSGLARRLEHGSRCEARVAAEAIAAIARDPCSHKVAFSAGVVPTLARVSGSKDPGLFDAQYGVARTWELLASNTASQFGLVDAGVCPALKRLVLKSPPACVAPVCAAVMHLAAGGYGQADMLVHAGIVPPLVRLMPAEQLAQQALHSLVVEGGEWACLELVRAKALQALHAIMLTHDTNATQRSLRMIGQILQLVPEAIPNFVERQAFQPLLDHLLHDSLCMQAEAVDVLFLLRHQKPVLTAMATPQGLQALAALLTDCVARRATLLSLAKERRAVSRALDSSGATLQESALLTQAQAGAMLSVEAGFYPELARNGSKVRVDVTAGKATRLLLYMAREPALRSQVAGCTSLARPLAAMIESDGVGQAHAAMYTPPLEPASQGAEDAPPAAVTNPPISGTVLMHGIADVSDRFIERVNAIRRRDKAVKIVQKAREFTMFTTTTAQTAELLLSFIHDSGQDGTTAVLNELVTQLWLGNNVDLAHSRPAA